MPPPWVHAGSPSSAGGCSGPGPLVLLPVVIYVVRSNGDLGMVSSLGKISKTSPKALADNAHRIIQGMLAKLPSEMLYWFCSKVLNLSPDISMNTVDFIKSQPAVGSWESSSGADEVRMRSSSEMIEPTGGQDGIEQRLKRLEATLRTLETTEMPTRLLDYRSEDARDHPLSNDPYKSLNDHGGGEVLQNTMALSLVGEQTQETTDGSTALISSRSPARLDSSSVAQELGLRLGHILLDWAGERLKQSFRPTVAS